MRRYAPRRSSGTAASISRATYMPTLPTAGPKVMTPAPRPRSELRGDDLDDGALHLEIVGDGLADRGLAGGHRLDPAPDELAGVDQKPCRTPLLQAVGTEVSHLLGDLYQLGRGVVVDPRLGLQDGLLGVGRRVVEVDGHEALLGRVLQ